MKGIRPSNTYIGLYNITEPLNYSLGSDGVRPNILDRKFQFTIRCIDSDFEDEYPLSTYEKISVALRGEIFNLNELAHELEISDKELRNCNISSICCRLYLRYGLDFLCRLNGLFSMVLRDEKEDLLVIAVDRYGLAKPVFYNNNGKRLLFSSHLKTLLGEGTIPREINTQGLALFLKYAYIPSPLTIIKNTHKLGPGERIICKGSGIKIERYVDFKRDQQILLESEATHKYEELFSRSLARRLINIQGEKAGIFLSGGLDSSANIAFSSQISEVPLEAFSVGFEGEKNDERKYARIVAEHYGVPFHEYVFTGDEIEDLPQMLWYLEEPFMENGLFLTYAGFKSISPEIKTIITGNCADQLFGTGGFSGGIPIALRYIIDKAHLAQIVRSLQTYCRNPIFYNDNLFFKIKVMHERISNFNDWFFWGLDDHQLREACSFPIDARTLSPFQNTIDKKKATFEDYYQHSLVHQDIEHYSCQNIIVKTHRMAEMHSVSARDPFLDYELVDFILGLSLDLKRYGSIVDYLCKKTKTKYLHRLAVGEKLPKEILSKQKQGGDILMTLLLKDNRRRRIIFDFLQKEEVIKEFINKTYVDNLIKKYISVSGKRIYWQNFHNMLANQILYLMTFGLWKIIILENKDIPPKASLSEIIE